MCPRSSATSPASRLAARPIVAWTRAMTARRSSSGSASRNPAAATSRTTPPTKSQRRVLIGGPQIFSVPPRRSLWVLWNRTAVPSFDECPRTNDGARSGSFGLLNRDVGRGIAGDSFLAERLADALGPAQHTRDGVAADPGKTLGDAEVAQAAHIGPDLSGVSGEHRPLGVIERRLREGRPAEIDDLEASGIAAGVPRERAQPRDHLL